MQEATIRLPKDIVDLWRSSERRNVPIEKGVKQEMVLALVRRHRISASKGAGLLGMDYQDFLKLMGQNEIPLFDYEAGEIERDVEILEESDMN